MLGCTKADFGGMILLVAGAMALGGLINGFRGDRLPLRYQTRTEQIDDVVRQISAADAEVAPLIDAEKVDPGMTLAEFRALAESRRGLILDARPEAFYRLGHVPGARGLSRSDFKSDYAAVRAKLEASRRERIAVYCTGNDCDDSRLVGAALRKLGYANVTIFGGGWSEWQAAGLPEEKGRP